MGVKDDPAGKRAVMSEDGAAALSVLLARAGQHIFEALRCLAEFQAGAEFPETLLTELAREMSRIADEISAKGTKQQ
jgi:hypothetical protein